MDEQPAPTLRTSELVGRRAQARLASEGGLVSPASATVRSSIWGTSVTRSCRPGGT